MRRLLLQIALYGAVILGAIGAASAGVPKWLFVGALVVLVVPLAFLVDRWAPAQPRSQTGQHTRGLWKEIGLLSISLLFCAAGVLTLRGDWRGALVTLAFFGGCALVALDVLRRRLRERRLGALGIERVGIIGGVDIPMARGRFVAMGGGLAALGVIMYAFGVEYPLTLRILALFIAAVGLTLLVALPFLSKRRIRFDPQGVLIGELRYEYRVPWDDILSVGLVEQASNIFVTLQLRDAGAIAVAPPSRRDAFLRGVRTTRAWHGADVSILALHFGLQASLLAGAIGRYASDPDARHELAERLLEQQA